jgi:glycosyltransferase involved in cell wall biosynthesis
MTSVSILIPCYNAERWLAHCIESALGQTQSNVEVIIVDDGSADGSLDVIRSFGDRVRWETGPNRGGNVARNRLLELATGDWVQFLDADDYLRPEKIASQLQSYVDSGRTADVIHSPVTIEVWKDGRIDNQSVGQMSMDATLAEQWIRWEVAQTGSLLWRRETLMAIGGWNEEYPCCQDNELTLRAIQHGLKFHFCPNADAVYRIWSQETVCRKDPFRVIRYRTHLIEQMLTWLTGLDQMTASITQAAGQAFFEMARTMAVFDLPKAVSFQKVQASRRRYLPVGPAAPRAYRILHAIFGFHLTEIIARALRR